MSDNYEIPKPLAEAIQKKKFSSCVEDLRALAEGGSPGAFIALGHIFFRGGDGIPKDYKEALYWLSKVKHEYDVTGFVEFHIGMIYDRGFGVSIDRRIAFKYFRSAALHGNRHALLMVAAMQRNGEGTFRKSRTAETIFRYCVCNKKSSIFMRFYALVSLSPTTRPLKQIKASETNGTDLSASP